MIKQIFAFTMATICLTLFAGIAFAGQDAPYDRIVDKGVLRCGYYVWPPFLSKDPNTGKLSGISYNIVETMGDILGLKIEWVAEVGGSDYIEGLQSNRFDAMCVSTWPHPTRFKQSLATTPLFYTSVYPVVRNDDTRLDKDYSLLSKGSLKLGVIEGDDTEASVQKFYPTSPRETLPNSSDYTQLIVALLSKRSDVIFLDKSVISDFIKNNGPKIKIPKKGDSVFLYPEYLFVKRGDVQTKMMFDTAIQLMKDRGQLDNFLKQYVTSSTTRVDDIKNKK